MREIVFIDTNAFFKSRAILEKLIKEGTKLATSSIVIYEFVKIIDELIALEQNEKRRQLYIKLKNRFPKLLKELSIDILSHQITYDDLSRAYDIISQKNVDIGDALIYILMKKKNIKKILTFDDDWLRLDVTVLGIKTKKS